MTVVGKFDALFEFVLGGRRFVVVSFVANDSGALPLSDKKGEWGELQRKVFWKNEQLLLTLKEFVENESRYAGDGNRCKH